jgi:hypothetical protein
LSLRLGEPVVPIAVNKQRFGREFSCLVFIAWRVEADGRDFTYAKREGTASDRNYLREVVDLAIGVDVLISQGVQSDWGYSSDELKCFSRFGPVAGYPLQPHIPLVIGDAKGIAAWSNFR